MEFRLALVRLLLGHFWSFIGRHMGLFWVVMIFESSVIGPSNGLSGAKEYVLVVGPLWAVSWR